MFKSAIDLTPRVCALSLSATENVAFLFSVFFNAATERNNERVASQVIFLVSNVLPANSSSIRPRVAGCAYAKSKACERKLQIDFKEAAGRAARSNVGIRIPGAMISASETVS